MTTKIIIAGFGGQGIILSGKILAYSAMMEGKEVTNFASYGAEMRGGTCNCFVVISDRAIASPVIDKPDITLVLNQPSKEKFETICKENSIILLNNSLINNKVLRADLRPYYIDATNIADKLGSVKSTNMVMLGGLIKATGIIKRDTIINILPEVISSRNKSLLEINAAALKEGYNSI
jgi:2-oxoglutarate ferredoxin oxidoreductase subunit gamma